VKVENSLDFAAALRKAKVPFELHIYEKGAHGLALAPNHPWPNDCIYWLKGRGFVKKP
jgi:dipeptidyl aminopeptidase/acylaminoacyl peptidase